MKKRINLCGRGCTSCPEYDEESGMVIENNVEIDPRYILEIWAHKDPNEDTIEILGIKFDENIINNLINVMK